MAGLLALLLGVRDSESGSAGLQTAARTKAASDFVLPALDGTHVRLRSLRGKVILLNFWATWCSPCRYEMPSMETLYNRFKGQGFEVLAVSIDSKGKEAVASFAKELNLTFPILLDRDMAVMAQLGVRGLPTTYLLDRNGFIAQVAVGPKDWAGKEGSDLVRGLISERGQK